MKSDTFDANVTISKPSSSFFISSSSLEESRTGATGNRSAQALNSQQPTHSLLLHSIHHHHYQHPRRHKASMASFQGTLAKGGNRRLEGTLTFDRTAIKMRYEGSFGRNGRPHGSGTLGLPDGSVYEGDFEEGEIQGTGLRTYVDSSSYSGDFQQGERHGQGVFLGPNPVRCSRTEGAFALVSRRNARRESVIRHARCSSSPFVCQWRAIQRQGQTVFKLLTPFRSTRTTTAMRVRLKQTRCTARASSSLVAAGRTTMPESLPETSFTAAVS